jgi:hypothetical protein
METARFSGKGLGICTELKIKHKTLMGGRVHAKLCQGKPRWEGRVRVRNVEGEGESEGEGECEMWNVNVSVSVSVSVV